MNTIQENDPNPLIAGFHITSDGQVSAIEWSEIVLSTAEQSGKRTWVHLNRHSSEAKAWLEGEGGLDPIIVNVLFQEDTRPRANRIAGGFLINLRGVNLNPGADAEDMISLRIWATEHLVVTTRAHRIMAIDDLCARFERGDPPKSSGDLVCFLAERLTNRIEPVVQSVEEQADALEEEWLDLSTPAPKQKLAQFRRSALSLRRYIAPQREAISSLVRDTGEFLTDEARLRLREVQDITTRMAEDLDLVRERAVVIQEQIVEQRAEAMNQRLFALAIISAVFLPLGFFTGLFGVNIGGMPGVESSHAFALFCVALVALTGGLLYLFRKADWL